MNPLTRPLSNGARLVVGLAACAPLVGCGGAPPPEPAAPLPAAAAPPPSAAPAAAAPAPPARVQGTGFSVPLDPGWRRVGTGDGSSPRAPLVLSIGARPTPDAFLA